MEPIVVQPVGVVRSTRTEPIDDGWDREEAVVELVDSLPADCLSGLTDFSHAEIIYCFHRIAPDHSVPTVRHPRDNRNWPRIGTFAQRGKDRPNRLGLTVVRILKIDGRRVFVAGLDAIDGSPVLDIKPWAREFGPRGDVRQPSWMTELMAAYWSAQSEGDGV